MYGNFSEVRSGADPVRRAQGGGKLEVPCGGSTLSPCRWFLEEPRIARAEASCAALTVVVCPAERHLTQDGGKDFVATARVARRASASRAWQIDGAVVGAVRVQSSGNRHAREAKCLTTRGYLDGFEIPFLDRGPYEGFDL